MVRGLPKSYIKKWGVSKRAWREYRKKHPKSKSKSSSKTKTTKKKTSKSTKKGGNRKMGKSLQQTVFKWIRVAGLLAPVGRAFVEGGSPAHMANTAISRWTGYSFEEGIFRWEHLVEGWSPFVAACLATYGIPKLVGIIRRL